MSLLKKLFGGKTENLNQSLLSKQAALAENACLLDGSAIVQKLNTHEASGLNELDAKALLQEYGENLLADTGGVSALTVFLRQIANALTLVLAAAMALSYGVQDWVEGAVITAVIVLNVVVGFFQEYKAEKTMESLRSLSSPTAIVVRNGEAICIPAKLVVPGDIVNVKMGDVVPADLRMLFVSNLEIDEALLTGEAIPVSKVDEPIKADPTPSGDIQAIGVGDRINMAFASTVVTRGRGAGVVVATGMSTQIGRIALAMGKKDASDLGGEPGTKPAVWAKISGVFAIFLGLSSGTPLQIKLNRLAYLLLIIAIVLALVVFAVARFNVTNEVALYAIALGIGVIPESLVAVLTITMSVGTLRMAKQNVIVRKLNALEALGGVTDICSDKTGTLTQGKMTVRKVWMPPSKTSSTRELTVEPGPEALNPEGKVYETIDGQEMVVDTANMDQRLTELVMVASMCNVASIAKNKDNRWTSTGDSTEVALQVFAHKMGMGKPSLVTNGLFSPTESSQSKGLGAGNLKKEQSSDEDTDGDTRPDR
ncbi:hypothetical protein D9758_009933 [Tetrapyrgos nigripes]|uniref:Cation-transporting P-type ATPase N-terminal domain-containing protein n=1 Tax=Tetrapyrgos nigripes TaxID=182062 RepID=A0A8H5CT42_9AGAR|nr:hypothetical protein D9758_009933 [Tetrapyrgos nigripes]